jgi:hypothetical protein
MSSDDPAAILAGWREAERAAADGPWRVKAGHLGGHPKYVTAPDDSTVAECWMDDDGSAAGFIATARTAMPLLLAAVEAVLKAAERLDSERGDYGHLVNRHEAAATFREAITTPLTGAQPAGPPQSEEDRRAAAEALEGLRTRLAGKGDGDG